MKKIYLFLVVSAILISSVLADANDYGFIITRIKYANGTPYSDTNSTKFELYNTYTGGAITYSATQTIQYNNGTAPFTLYDVNEANYTTPTSYLQITIGSTTLSKRFNISSFKRYNTSNELFNSINNGSFITTGSKTGNTTAEIRNQFSSSANISYDSTTGKYIFNMTCEQITGSADLCDGSDATGSGGSSPFTNVDNIYIYNATGTLTFNESKYNLTWWRNYALSGYYTNTNFTAKYALMGYYTTTNFTTDHNAASHSYIGNCSASQSCTNVLYWGDKTGNTTTEIRAQFTGSRNISILNGIITFNMTCEQITGSASLCDGDDAIGGGGAAGDKWLDSGSYIEPNSSFASNVKVFGYIHANDWTNVTVTESQITDLAHIGNCSADQSCANILYWGDKTGNTTAEINAVETDPQVSTITAGKVCVGNGPGTAISCTNSTTGTGNFVLATSPVIVTPRITLSTSATTTSGDIYYDATNDWINVYDGSAVDNYVSTGVKTDEYVCTYESTGTKLDCDGTTTGSGSFVKGTSPAISTPALTLATTMSSATGRIYYNATADTIQVGDGTAIDRFYSGGTMTNSRYCTYNSANYQIDCNTNPDSSYVKTSYTNVTYDSELSSYQTRADTATNLTNYLPLAGGTMTGNITVSASNSIGIQINSSHHGFMWNGSCMVAQVGTGVIALCQ